MSICKECELYGVSCIGYEFPVTTCPLFQKKPNGDCQKFAETVCKIFDDIKDLYAEKAKQYAQGDPLANFRGGAALQGLNPESLDDCFRVLLGYCDKHIAFVHQSGKLGKKEAESLKDIANYMVIALGMYQMKRENEDET